MADVSSRPPAASIPLSVGPPLEVKAPAPPRLLTPVEIDNITDVIPRIQAAIKKVSERVREQIRYKLKTQLEELRLCPDRIPDIKNMILNQFYRSLIHPGEPFGITAAEAIGAPATQLTLNTFHQAGAKASSMGIDAYQELFNASQKRKYETTTIHFKNKNLSFEEVIEYRRELVGVTVGSLLKSTEIIPTYGEAEGREFPIYPPQGAWWYNMYLTIMNKSIPESKNFLRIYFNTSALYLYKVQLNDIVSALEMNLPKMVTCVASPTIMGIIDIYPIKDATKKPVESILSETSRRGINEDNITLLFINLILIPRLNTYNIKGIPKITQLFPVSITTWSVIRSEKHSYHKDVMTAYLEGARAGGYSEAQIAPIRKSIESKWTLWLDIIRLKLSGISLDKIKRLLEIADVKVISMPVQTQAGLSQNMIHIEMPGVWNEVPLLYVNNERNPLLPPGWVPGLITPSSSSAADIKVSPGAPERPPPKEFVDLLVEWIDSNYPGKSAEAKPEGAQYLPEGWLDSLLAKRPKAVLPGDYINDLLQRQQRKDNKWVEDRKAEGIIYPVKSPNDLLRAGNYVYAEANGSNLKKLLAQRIIDSRLTISNNPHEILATFGIEAARNFIARNFYEIISSSSYVNSRYISIIADFMTNMGTINPITSRGVARQMRGAFADASFERPVDAFIKSATSGKWENVVSTSACIFMGKRMLLGTGAMGLALREDVLKENEKAALDVASGLERVDVKAHTKKVDEDLLTAPIDFVDHGIMDFNINNMATRDSKFVTPDPKASSPSTQVQSKLEVKGSTASVLPPIGSNIEPIRPEPPLRTGPLKGPIPGIRETKIGVIPWIASILRDLGSVELGSDLPSLSGFNIRAVQSAVRAPTEVRVAPVSVAAFLAD